MEKRRVSAIITAAYFFITGVAAAKADVKFGDVYVNGVKVSTGATIKTDSDSNVVFGNVYNNGNGNVFNIVVQNQYQNNNMDDYDASQIISNTLFGVNSVDENEIINGVINVKRLTIDDNGSSIILENFVLYKDSTKNYDVAVYENNGNKYVKPILHEEKNVSDIIEKINQDGRVLNLIDIGGIKYEISAILLENTEVLAITMEGKIAYIIPDNNVFTLNNLINKSPVR